MTNDKILHKWVNGELSAGELKTFKLRPEYQSLVDLYENTEKLAAPAFDREAMLSEVLKQEKKKSPAVQKGRRVFLSKWVKYSVAASLLLVVGWFLFLRNSGQTVIELAKGERQEGVLPDQSTFVLNAESILSFNKKTWEDARILNLQGEAFFEVQKGSKFTVVTPTGQVQVLGTKFNVRSRNGIMEVACQRGKVAVLAADGKLVGELYPNDALRIEPGKALEKWQTAPAENPSWVDGITKMRKVALSQVLEELERQFNVKINPGNINTNEIISCNFQHKNLELALKTTLSPLGIKYEIQNGSKIFLKK